MNQLYAPRILVVIFFSSFLCFSDPLIYLYFEIKQLEGFEKHNNVREKDKPI